MKQFFIKYRFSEDYKDSCMVDSLQKASKYENNNKNGLKIRVKPRNTSEIVQKKQLKKYIKVIYNGTN